MHRQRHDLRFVRLGQQFTHALDQWAAVSSEHERKEDGFKAQDAALDGGDLALNPIAQDAVDGDVTLLKRGLFISLARAVTIVVPWLLLEKPLRPSFCRCAQLDLAASVLEGEQNFVLLEVASFAFAARERLFQRVSATIQPASLIP